MSQGYYRGGQYYVDTTTPSAPVLYRCITAGTKSTSVWAPISGGGGSGWNYRGAWAAGSYNLNDVVSLGSGTSSGMYLSLIGSNTNAPDSGIGWVQLSTSAGTWM
jgi:hypothetical protein